MHSIAYVLAAAAVIGAILATVAAVPMMQAQNETGDQPTGNNETTPVLTGNETGPMTLNETGQPEPVPIEEPEGAPVATEGEGPFNITASQVPEEATITVSLASLTAGNNVTVIEPDGNVTVVPDVNVTVIDNDTVVIAPPTENVTTIPENNVTVITPAPEPCGCPTGNETGLAPVIVRPAPGQEVTIEGGEVVVTNETGVVVEGQPEPEPEPTVPAENSTEVAPASFPASWMPPTLV
jgi:hypothetical protein